MNQDKALAGSDNYSDNYVISDEVADLLLSISNEELETLVMNAPTQRTGTNYGD